MSASRQELLNDGESFKARAREHALEDAFGQWPCAHIGPVTDVIGVQWKFETDADFGNLVYVPHFWNGCPVCLALRPGFIKEEQASYDKIEADIASKNMDKWPTDGPDNPLA